MADCILLGRPPPRGDAVSQDQRRTMHLPHARHLPPRASSSRSWPPRQLASRRRRSAWALFLIPPEPRRALSSSATLPTMPEHDLPAAIRDAPF
eukprot:9447466-Pyramimonas_sp.AAC.1